MCKGWRYNQCTRICCHGHFVMHRNRCMIIINYNQGIHCCKLLKVSLAIYCVMPRVAVQLSQEYPLLVIYNYHTPISMHYKMPMKHILVHWLYRQPLTFNSSVVIHDGYFLNCITTCICRSNNIAQFPLLQFLAEV